MSTAEAPAKVRLSSEAVVGRALAIADADGLAKVTLRRIADEFAVTPMALYWHFKNKDELLAAVGDAVLAELVVVEPAQPADDLDAGVAPALEALVAVLRAHPNVAELAAWRILEAEPGLVLAERVLGSLRAAGFSVAKSAELGRMVLQTALMLVRGEHGEEGELPVEEREAKHAQKIASLGELSAQKYPHVVEAGEALVECDETTYYPDGIALFMAGIRGLTRS